MTEKIQGINWSCKIPQQNKIINKVKYPGRSTSCQLHAPRDINAYRCICDLWAVTLDRYNMYLLLSGMKETNGDFFDDDCSILSMAIQYYPR